MQLPYAQNVIATILRPSVHLPEHGEELKKYRNFGMVVNMYAQPPIHQKGKTSTRVLEGLLTNNRGNVSFT